MQRIPPPKGDPEAPLQGLIFDCTTTPTRASSSTSAWPRARCTRTTRSASWARARRPSCSSWASSGRSSCPWASSSAGEVGYVATGLKSVRDAQVGDTITTVAAPAADAAARLPASQEPRLRGHLPDRRRGLPALRDALEKLHLNDASFTFEPESSVALGFGFRCGFLGLLHMEIVQERLEREFGSDLIASAPSVEYQVVLINGRGTVTVDNPSLDAERRREIEEIREPWVKLGVITPSTLHRPADGARRRTAAARSSGMEYLDPQARARCNFEMPLGRAHRRLLRPAQDPDPGLRLDGLRGDRLSRGQPRQGRRRWSPASRSTRCRSSSTAIGRQPIGRRLVERLED